LNAKQAICGTIIRNRRLSYKQPQNNTPELANPHKLHRAFVYGPDHHIFREKRVLLGSLLASRLSFLVKKKGPIPKMDNTEAN